MYSDDYIFRLSIINNLVNFHIISRRAEPCSNNTFISEITKDSIMTDDTLNTIIKSIMVVSLIPVNTSDSTNKDN